VVKSPSEQPARQRSVFAEARRHECLHDQNLAVSGPASGAGGGGGGEELAHRCAAKIAAPPNGDRLKPPRHATGDNRLSIARSRQRRALRPAAIGTPMRGLRNEKGEIEIARTLAFPLRRRMAYVNVRRDEGLEPRSSGDYPKYEPCDLEAHEDEHLALAGLSAEPSPVRRHAESACPSWQLQEAQQLGANVHTPSRASRQRRAHGALARPTDTIEHALELLKQFRASGETGRQEASWSVRGLGVISIFYHKGGRPLKGIVVDDGTCFSTFSKFRDWTALRLGGTLSVGPSRKDQPAAIAAAPSDHPAPDEPTTTCHSGSREVEVALPDAPEAQRDDYESALRGALRTPSPCGAPSKSEQSSEPNSNPATAAAPTRIVDSDEQRQRNVQLAELYEASAALLLLGGHTS
jgi:hypothetical protein